jgi:hypothetical protein
MSRIKVCLLSLMMLGLVAACASSDSVDAADVNEETFFRTFDIRFNARNRELVAYVEARVGGATGTTVRLDNDKTPSFEGQPMTQSTGEGLSRFFTGTYYYLRIYTDAPKASYCFTWTAKDGTQEEITIPMAAPVDRDRQLERAWVGAPNREKESVYLVTLGGKYMAGYFADIPQKPGRAFDLQKIVGPKRDPNDIEPLNYAFIRKLEAAPRSKSGPIRGSVRSTYEGSWGTLDLENL